ncbi:hypothetical protein F5050DRAFT_1580357, partial [Lentinula boryana]
MRLFGSALTALGGQTTFLQNRALETIPLTVETVENRFNFGIHTIIYASGKPLKAYEYYPFTEWFAQFIAQPGIQQYAKAFCDEVRNNPCAPADKIHTWDGDIYRELRGPDGNLFVNGGEEGRFFFLLHVDFFQSKGTTGRGKHRSTGVASMRCLNLPLHLREDSNNVYIPGFFQGPKEPRVVTAQLAPLLSPLMSDMKIAYRRGIR